jgi:hypothetical protein
VTFPCLIVWGARDETLPLSMGYKLQAQLPDAALIVIHDTKHSMQLERPRLSSSILREFIESGTRGRERISEIRPGALQGHTAAAHLNEQGTNGTRFPKGDGS